MLGSRGHRRARSPRRRAPGRGPLRRRAAAASTAAPPARSPRPGCVDARRCLSWLLQAEGPFPARAPRGARRPHLRLRRLPGGVPAEPPGARCGRPPGDERAVGRPARRCSTPTTTSCSPAPSAGTSRGARSATCGATRSSCSATSATATIPRRRRRCCVATSRHDDPLLRGHAVWAARRLGREDLLAAASSTETDPSVPGRAGRRRSDDPPVRHQRLPAQGRRDPDDALGALAPARSDDVRGAHHALRRRPRRGTPTQPFRVVRTTQKVLLPTPSLARRIDDAGRRDRRRAASCSIRRCRRPARPAPAPPVRRRAPRRRDHRAGRLPGPNLVLRHVLAGRRARHRGRRLPAGRGRAGGRAGRCPSVLVPPGRRHRPLPPARRRRAGGRARAASACRSTDRSS